MVSRIYTPLIAPYKRSEQPHPASYGKERSQETHEQEVSFHNSRQHLVEEADKPSLQSIQQYPGQKIPLKAVINDFNNTMNSLGVDELTRSEVDLYLKVTVLQASKNPSNTAYIKQTFRTAGKTLDAFIGKALGKTSHVVTEWVDAMLLQNIQFQSDLSEDEQKAILTPAPLKNSEANHSKKDNTASTNRSSQTSQFSLTDKITATTGTSSIVQQLKQMAGQADTESPENAIKLYNEALTIAQNNGLTIMEGQLWQKKAGLHEKAGNVREALDSFQKAESRFAEKNSLDRQASVLYSMGSLSERKGQNQLAQQYYEKLLALPTTDKISTERIRFKTLNHLGTLYLVSNNPQKAIPLLENAHSLMLQLNAPPSVQGDILSNLANGYQQNSRYSDAEATYRKSLQQAKLGNDKQRYIEILQKMDTLWRNSNQTEKALKAQNTLQKLMQ